MANLGLGGKRTLPVHVTEKPLRTEPSVFQVLVDKVTNPPSRPLGCRGKPPTMTARLFNPSAGTILVEQEGCDLWAGARLR